MREAIIEAMEGLKGWLKGPLGRPLVLLVLLGGSYLTYLGIAGEVSLALIPVGIAVMLLGLVAETIARRG
ncbi:MAG: hypothetical protein ACE5IG_01005 [Dehalococcoidia bacterium]